MKNSLYEERMKDYVLNRRLLIWSAAIDILLVILLPVCSYNEYIKNNGLSFSFFLIMFLMFMTVYSLFDTYIKYGELKLSMPKKEVIMGGCEEDSD